MKTLIVITYLPEAAQGRELEFAIAGWRRFFKESYHIAIVGEGLPKIQGDDITLIESPRVEGRPNQYRSHLDYVSCLKRVRAAFPDTEGFISVADDCYAVNDFDLTDVKLLKMHAPDVMMEPNSANMWRRDKTKTKAALLAAKLPTRNFTTHLPIWYEWDKIAKLWEQYDMERESYVIEDLYFNTYYPERLPYLITDTDKFKFTANTGGITEAQVQKAFKTKVWINNTPDGFVPILQALLYDYYFKLS